MRSVVPPAGRGFDDGAAAGFVGFHDAHIDDFLILRYGEEMGAGMRFFGDGWLSRLMIDGVPRLRQVDLRSVEVRWIDMLMKRAMLRFNMYN